MLGRPLTLWPDADTPGAAHMARIAARLLALGHDDVRLVCWPEAPAGGDAADFTGDLGALLGAARPYAPESAIAATRAPMVTFLHTVAPEAVDWIWPGRLARGKYSLLAGEPGITKTSLAIDVTARISCGRPMPDGALVPQGRVLFLTAEDGIADTIRPRLDAMGGDQSRVAVLEAVRETDGTRRPLSLVRDLDMLAAAIRDVDPV